MSDLAATRRRLPALWADSAKVYLIGIGIVTVAAVGGAMIILNRLPAPGVKEWDGVGVFLGLIFDLVLVPTMALVAYLLVQNVRPSWHRVAIAALIAAVLPLALFGLSLNLLALAIYFAPLAIGTALWTAAFFLLCREKPVQASVPAGMFAPVSVAESRGGFNSYEPDAAIRQAQARGESAFIDRMMGVPGSPTELLRLAVLIALIAAIIGSAFYGTAAFLRLPLGLPIAITVSLFAALFGGWLANRLTQAYRTPLARALAWGLSAAAGFLISLRIVLGLVLAAKFRLDGVGAEEAGIRAFHGAAWFTLMVAMPAWTICVLWGLARRRRFDARPPAQLWRRILPVVFIAAVMIFMAREGAYMDSLTQR